MRTNPVIFVFPLAYYLPCLLEIMEPIKIKTFVPEFPIETFNETVLHGFSGINKHMLYMLLTCPCIEGVTGEFGAVVQKDFFRLTTEQRRFIQVSFPKALALKILEHRLPTTRQAVQPGAENPEKVSGVVVPK